MDKPDSFNKILKYTVAFAFIAGFFIGTPASAQSVNNDNLALQSVYDDGGGNTIFDNYYPSNNTKSTVLSYNNNPINAGGYTFQIGETDAGLPRYLSIYSDSFDAPFSASAQATVWNVQLDGTIDVEYVETIDTDTHPLIMDSLYEDFGQTRRDEYAQLIYSPSEFTGGTDVLVVDKFEIYGIFYNDIQNEIVEIDYNLDNQGYVYQGIVDSKNDLITSYSSVTETLNIENFGGQVLAEKNMSTILNNPEDYTSFSYDPENNLHIGFRFSKDGSGNIDPTVQYTIADDTSALDSGTLDLASLSVYDLGENPPVITKYQADDGTTVYNIGHEAKFEYVNSTETNSGKDLQPLGAIGGSLSGERNVYRNLEDQVSIFQDDNGNIGLDDETATTGTDRFSDTSLSSNVPNEYPVSIDFQSYVAEINPPTINSLSINPNIINRPDSFDVSYDVEDPNGQGIEQVETILYDTDGTTTIASVTKSYSNVQVTDTVTRSELESAAGTSDLFDSEGDYEIEIRPINSAGEVAFQSSTLTVSSQFDIGNPVPYRIENGSQVEQTNTFQEFEKFQAEMSYTSGTSSDEMDIFLKPVNGWDEPNTLLSDNEWYSDTAIKTGSEGSGSVFTPISEVGVEFPFENTSGTFEMIGLANVGDSVPTTVTDSEISNFDRSTDVVTFDVEFNEPVQFNLNAPSDGKKFTGSQEIEFKFNTTDVQGLGYTLELNLQNDGSVETIYTDSVAEGINNTVSFSHTESLTTGSYNWSVQATKNNETYTSESKSFEIDPTIIDQIISTLVDPLQQFWMELMNELGDTGKAILGLIFVLASGAIGFAVAENKGAEIGMITAFLIAVLIGLFPGWIALIIALASLAVIGYGG